MAKKHSRLRLVDSPDPASVFDDLDALRKAQATPAGSASRGRRRPQVTELFVPIPYTLARKLRDHRVSGTAWFLLVALDQLIYQPGGRSPVKLTAETLASLGLSRWVAYQALEQLEKAGAVAVSRRRGRSPAVTLLWRQ
ncbi:MAG TPA: hypothetical protein VKE93_11115 [Candidatus Angelobacter sp.]|nr:hypothetical protein [Candidatus Angelobacter sp.]